MDSAQLNSAYRFVLPMSVRDYELDYQGVVNNSVYQKYMEHTRHEFCRAEGLTVARLHELGVDPVVSRADISFLRPLRSGENFFSCLNVERIGPRFIFRQDLFSADGDPVAKGVITVACMEKGRLTRGDVLADAFSI